MKLAEAVETARQGVIAKYAIKEAVLREMFYVDVSFMTYAQGNNAVDADHPIWLIQFRVKNYRDYGDDLGFFDVFLYDQTKEMDIISAADSVG